MLVKGNMSYNAKGETTKLKRMVGPAGLEPATTRL